jgi:hypothetical protein
MYEMDDRISTLETENKELREKIEYLNGQLEAYIHIVDGIGKVANDMHKYTPMLEYISDTITSVYQYMPGRITDIVPAPSFDRLIE